jgi:hypothetical protein
MNLNFRASEQHQRIFRAHHSAPWSDPNSSFKGYNPVYSLTPSFQQSAADPPCFDPTVSYGKPKEESTNDSDEESN